MNDEEIDEALDRVNELVESEVLDDRDRDALGVLLDYVEQLEDELNAAVYFDESD